MMRIRFAIERLERNGQIILLQAWAIPPQDWPKPYQLTIRGRSIDASGTPWTFVLEPNRDRPDVVRSLGLEDSALRCGFFFYGKLPAGEPESLWLTSPAGAQLLLPSKLPFSVTSDTPLENIWGGWRYLLKRAWALASGGQWRALRSKVKKHVRLAQVPSLPSRKTSDGHDPSTPRSVDCLVIDHDLGGGANQYRQQLIADQLAQGRDMALLTFSLLGLRYVLQYFHPARGVDSPIILAKLRWQDVLGDIEKLQPRQIFYNNAVSFPDAQRLASGIAIYKEMHPSCQLTLAVHDFFMICPSQHLMDAEGKFCHIPKDQNICAYCLSTSQQDLMPLYRQTAMAPWRQSWESLLDVADEVLAFDPSAADILRDAFTAILADKIALRPHAVPPLSADDRKLVEQWKSTKLYKSGRIGIVGNISSDYKGNKTVHALAEFIANERLPYKIICIGQTTPRPAGRGVYRETGSYRKEDLTKLVVENDIDVFYFAPTGRRRFPMFCMKSRPMNYLWPPIRSGRKQLFCSDILTQYHFGLTAAYKSSLPVSNPTWAPILL